MHRHGYQGRKFHRERDQREALIKSLAESLIIYESIETTLPKAKAVVPYVEQLITKAKKGNLHNRRQIISHLQTTSTANKLVDEIAPKLKGRTSGHLRITRTTLRRGDNTQLARVSFVDNLQATTKATDTTAATTTDAKTSKVASSAKKTEKATSAKKASPSARRTTKKATEK